MPVSSINVLGYRSIRRMFLNLNPVTVITGPNGCGKSNLYRSMYLLAEAANGRLASALAEEGGMPSVLWAGQRTKGPVRMTLAVRVDELHYEVTFGLPGSAPEEQTAFKLDPEIKAEKVSFQAAAGRPVVLLERKGPSAHVRDLEGRRVKYPVMMRQSESALSQIREPHLYPELTALRLEMNNWRFFHHFPTDSTAPARSPMVSVQTPLLSSDGHDLAAAIQTIFEIGNYPAVDEAIEALIPGAQLSIDIDHHCRMAVELHVPWMQRPLNARELSDGTLRYLYLLAALLSPRPPGLIALNEPEMSLHPDVIDPLGRLIAAAAKESQLWIVTHSEKLAESIAHHTGCQATRLKLENGETKLDADEDEED